METQCLQYQTEETETDSDRDGHLHLETLDSFSQWLSISYFVATIYIYILVCLFFICCFLNLLTVLACIHLIFVHSIEFNFNFC